jgi:hypothetical protein
MEHAMKALAATFTALFLISAPAFAGGFTMDLPRLTWPTEAPAPATTRSCVTATTPAPATVCTQRY